jgi:hypothetical protein
MPFYSIVELLQAEARQVAARQANEAERQKAAADFPHAVARQAYRWIAEALDLFAANARRGTARRSAALLMFEGQWKRERRWLRQHGLRLSGYDATEQFVRRIRLWRAAGVMQ